jgi:hypothetical protein
VIRSNRRTKTYHPQSPHHKLNTQVLRTLVHKRNRSKKCLHDTAAIACARLQSTCNAECCKHSQKTRVVGLVSRASFQKAAGARIGCLHTPRVFVVGIRSDEMSSRASFNSVQYILLLLVKPLSPLFQENAYNFSLKSRPILLSSCRRDVQADYKRGKMSLRFREAPGRLTLTYTYRTVPQTVKSK